jgi:hypothetical protein
MTLPFITTRSQFWLEPETPEEESVFRANATQTRMTPEINPVRAGDSLNTVSPIFEKCRPIGYHWLPLFGETLKSHNVNVDPSSA